MPAAWINRGMGRSVKPLICHICDKLFKVDIERGCDRKYCSSDCSEIALKKRAEERIARAPRCTVPGCNNYAKRSKDTYCEKHYGRLRRNGNLKGPEPRLELVKHQSGYMLKHAPDHPLAQKYGFVPEHRLVMYEKLGDQDHFNCHWCDAVLNGWDDVVIDHLNEDKADNNPDNLVISCNTCNRIRGSFIGFLRRVRPDRMEQVLELATQYKDELQCQAASD